jgi:hypothetical protein
MQIALSLSKEDKLAEHHRQACTFTSASRVTCVWDPCMSWQVGVERVETGALGHAGTHLHMLPPHQWLDSLKWWHDACNQEMVCRVGQASYLNLHSHCNKQ